MSVSDIDIVMMILPIVGHFSIIWRSPKYNKL